VLAARSTPACSDIANWLSSVPGTKPLAAYRVAAGAEMSKRCSIVPGSNVSPSQRCVAT
jgi:hypothetical protein